MVKAVKLQRVNNLIQVIYDDGTREFAYPSGNALWYVGSGGDVPPDPGGFKFPFPREQIDFESYYGHSGIDWPYGTGTPIPAIGPGTVVGVNEYSWAGNSVIVDHGIIGGIGITSLYAHMVDWPSVGYGDVVAGGQTLGYIGETGEAYGPHLHLEVIFNGERLPTSTPGQTSTGLGFDRTLAWLDANTDWSNW